MKKTLVIFMSALLCVFAAGCGEENNSSSTEATESVVADAGNVEKENEVEANAESKPEKEDSQAVDEPEAEEKETVENSEIEAEEIEEQSENKQEQPDENSNISVSEEDDVDPIALAEMYYGDACIMHQTVLMSCPYILDYDSMSADGWAPVNDPNCTDGIKSIEEYYCNLFTEPNEYIYERYKEIDGKLYCNDAARGTNIYYTNTTFELVEKSDGTFVYNAISHYNDVETGEPLEDEVAVFELVEYEDGYKVSEFTFPM